MKFTDASSGSISSWSWSFGNGATSTAQSPTYTYASAGTYTVSLTVAGSRGQQYGHEDELHHGDAANARDRRQHRWLGGGLRVR